MLWVKLPLKGFPYLASFELEKLNCNLIELVVYSVSTLHGVCFSSGKICDSVCKGTFMPVLQNLGQNCSILYVVEVCTW